jgi:hypothetical protein
LHQIRCLLLCNSLKPSRLLYVLSDSTFKTSSFCPRSVLIFFLVDGRTNSGCFLILCVLDAFLKSLKSAVSFSLYRICLCVRLRGTTRLTLEDFHEIWYFSISFPPRKYVEKILVFIKIGQVWRVLFMKTRLKIFMKFEYFFPRKYIEKILVFIKIWQAWRVLFMKTRLKIFVKFDIWVFLPPRKYLEKILVFIKSDKCDGYFSWKHAWGLSWNLIFEYFFPPKIHRENPSFH